MKVFENRAPGFVSVHIEHTTETAQEAQEIMQAVKKLLVQKNARRIHDGRPAMAYRIEIDGQASLSTGS